VLPVNFPIGKDIEMYIAFWVGLRIFLLPAVLFAGALFLQNSAGAAENGMAGPAGLGATVAGLASGGSMDAALGQLGALMGGASGGKSGCNNYGFGCAISHNPGAKFVRP